MRRPRGLFAGAPIVADQPNVLHALSALVADRKANPPAERSYVVALLQGGVPKVAAKITEEAAEVVEAADEPGDEGRAHLVREVADLVFHSIVLMRCRDLAWEEVEAELARRFGISGIAEKEARGTGAGATREDG